jgi:hypothetical protein
MINFHFNTRMELNPQGGSVWDSGELYRLSMEWDVGFMVGFKKPREFFSVMLWIMIFYLFCNYAWFGVVIWLRCKLWLNAFVHMLDTFELR